MFMIIDRYKLYEDIRADPITVLRDLLQFSGSVPIKETFHPLEFVSLTNPVAEAKRSESPLDLLPFVNEYLDASSR